MNRTMPANTLIETLTTEHAVADRMPTFVAPEDRSVGLGGGGNDPAKAKAARKTRGCDPQLRNRNDPRPVASGRVSPDIRDLM